MYIIIISARDIDDLSIGFDRDRKRRQRELTNNKKIKGKYHVTFILKDNLGFAEHQEKTTYDLGYNYILRRNSDNAVLNKGNTINNAKTKINSIHWYVPHHTTSLEHQNILMDQIIRKWLRSFNIRSDLFS